MKYSRQIMVKVHIVYHKTIRFGKKRSPARSRRRVFNLPREIRNTHLHNTQTQRRAGGRVHHGGGGGREGRGIAQSNTVVSHVNVGTGEGVAVLLDLLDYRLSPVPIRLQPDADVLRCAHTDRQT